MAKEEKKYRTSMVCSGCGQVHVKEEPADSNRAEQWKLVALAASGVIALLAIWFWVFKWGVPLVKRIKGIE